MWRSRRWRKLLNLIQGLPATSAYVEAAAQDDEMAELMADEIEASKGEGRPRVAEFGLTEQLLAEAVDRLGELIAATVAAAGAKPPAMKPLPRPETAADRLAVRVADASYDYLMEQIEEARAREASGVDPASQ